MSEALRLAGLGRGRTSPNPAVGCVIVRDGEIVGRGFHVFDEVDHAEIVALKQAGGLACGATAYVTLEPCSHQGRSGPCSAALIAAGVTRVVAAMQDPNPRVGGEGFRKLREAGVAVEIDDAAARESAALNEPFVHFMRQRKPLVTLKAAVTLDGKIAAPEDNSGWITSERARAHVQTVRHFHDAILTGIGTVLADDCMLNDRSGLARGRPLLRVVVDSQLRIPLQSKMVRSANGDLLIATTSAASAERRRALESRGIEVIALDAPSGRTDLRALVELLYSRQCLSLMIEAGSKVNWGALEAGVVDKIFFYYAPKILGGMQSLPVAGGNGRLRRADAIRFKDVRLHQITEDEFAVEAWVAKAAI